MVWLIHRGLHLAVESLSQQRRARGPRAMGLPPRLLPGAIPSGERQDTTIAIVAHRGANAAWRLDGGTQGLSGRRALGDDSLPLGLADLTGAFHLGSLLTSTVGDEYIGNLTMVVVLSCPKRSAIVLFKRQMLE